MEPGPPPPVPPPQDPGPPGSDLQQGRDARIRQLEHRLATRSSTGVRIPIALLGIACAGALLFWQRADVAYLLSPRAPISLGQEGDYRFEALRSNRHAQLHGMPTVRGAYARERGEVTVTIGLRDTPVLVHRGALGRELGWTEGTVPPSPDARPFAVGGRLLRDDEAPRYAAAFALLRAGGEVSPRDGHLWIVMEGERPGSDGRTAAVAILLVLFAGVNAWLLVRGVREQVRRRATGTPRT